MFVGVGCRVTQGGFEISSATGQGIEELKYAMAAKVLN